MKKRKVCFDRLILLHQRRRQERLKDKDDGRMEKTEKVKRKGTPINDIRELEMSPDHVLSLEKRRDGKRDQDIKILILITTMKIREDQTNETITDLLCLLLLLRLVLLRNDIDRMIFPHQQKTFIIIIDFIRLQIITLLITTQRKKTETKRSRMTLKREKKKIFRLSVSFHQQESQSNR